MFDSVLNNCSVICIVTLWCVLHQTHSEFWHIQNSAYSDICSHLIQAYTAPCITLAYSKTYHIPNPGIFRTGGIFKTLRNFDQVYSERYCSHNSLFRYYSAIFRTLGNDCICRNFGMFGILQYSTTFHNSIPMHIQNPIISWNCNTSRNNM